MRHAIFDQGVARLRALVVAAVAFAAVALAPGAASAQEILQPDPAFSAKKVVSIQLKALQRNDTPRNRTRGSGRPGRSRIRPTGK